MFIPDIIKETARTLRKNMTFAEKILWEQIRRGQILKKQFLKQKPIFVFEENSGLPRYIIADFICIESSLIIEIDGSIHNVKEVLILDNEKEKLLKNKGFKIIRFTNEEVMNNIKGVLAKIKESLE